MNAFLIIPGGVFDAIYHETVTAVILPAQEVCEVPAGLRGNQSCVWCVLGKEGSKRVHSALRGIGAVAQEIVNHFLRNSRSEGRSLCALRFLDDL